MEDFQHAPSTSPVAPDSPNPLKRKPQDEYPGAISDAGTPSPGPSTAPLLPATGGIASSVAAGAAQRAFIARTAPYLLEGSGGASPSASSSTSSAYGTNRSPRSRSHSRTPSASQAPSSDGEDRSDGEQGGEREGNVSSKAPSRHKVPHWHRGPIPRPGDAEDICPAPVLVAVPGFSTLHSTLNFPINRNGWRYTACGPATFDLPNSVYRTLEVAPASVHWSWLDRSLFTRISADGETVGTDRGFRAARSNVGVREGKWYAEIEVLAPEAPGDSNTAAGSMPMERPAPPMRDGPHVRLGWGRREASLNAPVGFDAYSYGIRDRTGEKLTMSRCARYGQAFGPGDVIGIYISLPGAPKNPPPRIRRKRIPIRYKGQLYFESLEYAQTKEMEALMERSRKGEISIASGKPPTEPVAILPAAEPALGATAGKKRRGPGAAADPPVKPKQDLRPLPVLHGSRIGFFVNGAPQGVAFSDLFDFRPLPRPKQAAPPPKKGSRNAPRADDDDDDVQATITSSSSLATIMKSRENAFDDGELGYFPFVSLFGGARARLISGPEFRYSPPDDIDAALDAVDTYKEGKRIDGPLPLAENAGGRKWRPLSERFDESLAEQWQHDLADEQRAAVRAAKMPPPDPESSSSRFKKSKKPNTARSASSVLARRLDEDSGDSPAPGELGGLAQPSQVVAAAADVAIQSASTPDNGGALGSLVDYVDNFTNGLAADSPDVDMEDATTPRSGPGWSDGEGDVDDEGVYAGMIDADMPTIQGLDGRDGIESGPENGGDETDEERMETSMDAEMGGTEEPKPTTQI